MTICLLLYSLIFIPYSLIFACSSTLQLKTTQNISSPSSISTLSELSPLSEIVASPSDSSASTTDLNEIILTGMSNQKYFHVCRHDFYLVSSLGLRFNRFFFLLKLRNRPCLLKNSYHILWISILLYKIKFFESFYHFLHPEIKHEILYSDLDFQRSFKFSFFHLFFFFLVFIFPCSYYSFSSLSLVLFSTALFWILSIIQSYCLLVVLKNPIFFIVWEGLRGRFEGFEFVWYAII